MVIYRQENNISRVEFTGSITDIWLDLLLDRLWYEEPSLLNKTSYYIKDDIKKALPIIQKALQIVYIIETQTLVKFGGLTAYTHKEGVKEFTILLNMQGRVEEMELKYFIANYDYSFLNKLLQYRKQQPNLIAVDISVPNKIVYIDKTTNKRYEVHV
ncbi:MAG: hypothetical protein QXD03_04515 [Candidatus Anstonellales archaeon]